MTNERNKVYALADRVCKYAAEHGGMTYKLIKCVERAATRAGMAFIEDDDRFTIEDTVYFYGEQ